MVRLFIGSTPRSGNTWFSRSFSDLLGLTAESFLVPASVDWRSLPKDCTIAMHRRRTQTFQSFLREREFRFIAVARHPLDIIVSILAYAQHPQNREFSRMWIEGECGDESSLAGATPTSESFVRYALGWRAAALLDVSLSWARVGAHAYYERLVTSPHEEYARLCAQLRVEARKDVDAVIARHSLEAMRASLPPAHVWRGEPGIWRRLIVPELARAIGLRHREAFATFGYEGDADPDLSESQAESNWRLLLRAQPLTA